MYIVHKDDSRSHFWFFAELDATARQDSVRASEWEPLLQVSQTQTEEELVASLADARESSAATADERAPLLCHLEDALNKVNITQDVDADPQSEENNEQVRDVGADTDDDDFAFRDCSAAPIDDVTRVAVENQEVKQAAEHDDVCDDVDDVTAAKTRARREEEAMGASEEVVASANCEEAKPTFDVFDPFTDAGDHKRYIAFRVYLSLSFVSASQPLFSCSGSRSRTS